MKLRYIGESFGPVGLTNGKEYDCFICDKGMLHVYDDSGDHYLYSPINPRPFDEPSKGGKWEVAEDDEKGTLATYLTEAERIYGR